MASLFALHEKLTQWRGFVKSLKILKKCIFHFRGFYKISQFLSKFTIIYKNTICLKFIMVYPATMESLSLNFHVPRSNGLAVGAIWSHKFSGHFSAILVIHRKFVPYIFLESARQGAADEPIKRSKSFFWLC